ncbi:unnamed protein product [Dovyalis caffra]|uniref:Uncharacterized protein n=1 Tax=Dovyalis caffra TaxID=77055 RepID=A0AAV1R155_9ROSI|nr:unnamed protein product [Dovyalis caffra]
MLWAFVMSIEIASSANRQIVNAKKNSRLNSTRVGIQWTGLKGVNEISHQLARREMDALNILTNAGVLTAYNTVLV